MNLLKTHKKIDQEKAEEMKKLNEEANDKFLHFQLDNSIRAQILNPFQGEAVVSMVMEHAFLGWRKMEDEEKKDLQTKLAQKAGIDLSK